MEQLKVKIGLLRVITKYTNSFKEHFIDLASTIIISVLMYVLLAQIRTDSIVIQLCMSLLLVLITGFSLYVIFLRMAQASIKTSKRQVLKATGYILLFGLMNISILFLTELFPVYKIILSQVLPLILDLFFVVIIYKKVIKVDGSSNTTSDNIFLVKFGVFYYFIRIAFVLISGAIISTIISIENRPKYLPMIGNLIKLIVLPLICVYYEEKRKNDIELGINI